MLKKYLLVWFDNSCCLCARLEQSTWSQNWHCFFNACSWFVNNSSVHVIWEKKNVYIHIFSAEITINISVQIYIRGTPSDYRSKAGCECRIFLLLNKMCLLTYISDGNQLFSKALITDLQTHGNVSIIHHPY